MYRAMQRKRQELYNSGAVDDSRMDKLLITGLVAVRPPCLHCAPSIHLCYFMKIDIILCGHA